MRDAFGVERSDISKSTLVPGPGFVRRAASGSNDVGEVVPPARQAKAKIKGQWSKAAADSGSGQSGVGGPALIGSSLDDVSKGMPGASDVHSNAPVVREPGRKQRRRDRRLSALAKGYGGQRMVGDTTGIRGGVSSNYKAPFTPGTPDVKAIKGKLAPLKEAMVASTKIK